MRKLVGLIPDRVRILLLRLSIAVLLLYLTRIIFYTVNSSAFPNISIIDFITAIWFDCITVGLFYIPYYVLFLLPINHQNSKSYRIGLKFLFHSVTTLLLAANLLDVEYFKYTSKRSTSDLFTLVGTGDDVKQLLGSFFIDFWHLIVMLIALIIIAEFLYRKTD